MNVYTSAIQRQYHPPDSARGVGDSSMNCVSSDGSTAAASMAASPSATRA